MDVSRLIQEDTVGKWYTVPGSDVEVKIRRLKPKEIDAMRRRSRARRFDGRRGELDVDADKLSRLMLCEMVTEWKNISMGEEPLPCTNEEKVLLDKNWMAFRQLWNSVWLEGESDEAAREEEEQGN